MWYAFTMSDDMTERKPGRLRSLRITRVDRVAAGANPDAHVVLFKREELEDNPTLEDVTVEDSQETDLRADERQTETEQTMTEVDRESLAPEIAALLTEAESERDAALAKNAELEATIAETVIADEPAVEAEDEDEEVLKALDPTVRSRIEKAAAERNVLAERVAKMEDEALTRDFVAKATEFNAVDADADSLGALLKDVAKNCDTETVQTLERLLKSTAAKITESQRLILAEIGTAAGLDLTDAGQRIESLAKARAEQTGEAMPVATAAILNDNPHLYEQARAERI